MSKNKEPITHQLCITRNHTCLKICFAVFLIIITILVDETILKPVVLQKFVTILEILVDIYSFALIFSALQTYKHIKKFDYFIYTDVVSGRRKQLMGWEYFYYLKFKNNKYELRVSNYEYENIKDGTKYFLLQINDKPMAYSALNKNDYYIDKSIQDKVRDK